MHQQKSQLANKRVRIKHDLKTLPEVLKGSELLVEDWWDRIAGKSWMDCNGNPAAMIYGLRSGYAALPLDNEVLYGKVDYLGHLIHISEIEEESAQ